MKDLSQLALAKIKKKNIQPAPSWGFMIKNYAWWVAGILSILVGGLAVSVIIYMLLNNDWDIYQMIGTSLLVFVLVSVPYFWPLFLLLFILLADYYLKHTKYGYRFTLVKIVSLSVVSSIVLGTLFYNIGLGEAMNREFSESVPGYGLVAHNKENLWMQPDQGLLAGTIVSIIDNNNFVINDLNSKKWNIEGDNLILRRSVNFSVASQIKLIGKIVDANTFVASDLRPWAGNGEGGRGMGGQGMRFNK